jgi:NADH-quinone oxidoreductase subunit H
VIVHALVRALETIAAAALALPIVAWLESLRARPHPASGAMTGPRGAFTALASAIKLLEKRAPRTLDTDRLLHGAAPVLALIPTLAVLALLPVSPDDDVASTLPLVLSMPLLSTSAVALAGFAGGNRLAHLSALRLVALRLSVLVVVGAAAMALAHAAGSVDMPVIAAVQAKPIVGALARWGIITAPTACLAAVVALAVHAQHVLRSRTEPSLAEPWLGDATGPVLLGHRLFESLDLVAGAAIVGVIFLGAWHVPGMPAFPAPIASVTKTLIALVAIVLVRNALPTLTPSVALRVCWIVLLPLAVLALAIVEIAL